MKNLEDFNYLLLEWDFEKNLQDPKKLKSSTKYWWICERNDNHKWQAMLSHRINGRNCPYCSGQKTLEEESLGYLFPDLMKEWNFKKNNKDPFLLSSGSSIKVWWICKNNHSWKAKINPRTKRNVGCPYCKKKLPTEKYNLKSKFPDLIKEWDFERNKINPKNILPYSNKKAWWICNKGHIWQTKINNRTSCKSKCPYCIGQKIQQKDSIYDKFPNLMKEWDFSKNIINPKEISKGSSMKTWWICKQGHSWKASIYHRVCGSSCPKCSKRISKSCIKWLDSLNVPEREYFFLIKEKKFFIDGFDPKTNTCYEYYGNYWHGNPDIYNPDDINPSNKIPFGKLYQKTLNKEKLIKNAGYNLITKWGD